MRQHLYHEVEHRISLGSLKPCGMAWQRRRSFFLRQNGNSQNGKERGPPRKERKGKGEKERERGGGRGRGKKDLIRFLLEFTWLENKGSRIDRKRSRRAARIRGTFSRRQLDHWIFHGTPVSWKIEISFSTTAKSAEVNRDGSRNKCSW